MKKNFFSTKTLVLAGLCIALSTILSYLKLFKMPQGGSITAGSMIPLLFFAFVCGPIPGIISGAAYGLIQLALDGYVISLPQLLLDYPLAFASLGLAGLIPTSIKNNYLRFGLGSFLAIFCRGFMHVLSGVIFFADYAGDSNPWIYSIVYNYSFLAVEFIITLVIGMALVASPVYSSLKRTVATA